MTVTDSLMPTQLIGDVRIDRLVESEGPFADADYLLPQLDLALLKEHADWLYPRFVEPGSNQSIMSFHSLVLRTPRTTILVDCCVGNDKQRPARPGWHLQKTPWLNKLHQLGLQPDDIDIVLCTHLHADHVGWNTRLVDGQWAPTFPNARYVFAKQEYDFWEHAAKTHAAKEPLNHGSFDDSVLPIVAAGKAVLVDNDHQLDHGIWLEPAPGHTPGNVIVHVSRSDQHAVLIGDVMHSAIQLADPSLSSRFCYDANQSQHTRMQLIETFANTSTLILPGHFPTPTAGHIVHRGNSFIYNCCS